MFSTTEITSHEDVTDNVIHQRLFYAYVKAAEMISGEVLEIGCGAGRGLELMVKASGKLTGIDKNEKLVQLHQQRYPEHTFISHHIPPLDFLPNNHFDFVVSFQVIEHIENDELFVQEIQRVLKPGGKAIITTPNLEKSLTRNPWHVREYRAKEMQALFDQHFSSVTVKGISGAKKVLGYYEENKRSVEKITRFDVLNLQYRLPRWMLQIPYDILNRLNRRKLHKQTGALVTDVTVEDYFFAERPEEGFDFFCVAEK